MNCLPSAASLIRCHANSVDHRTRSPLCRPYRATRCRPTDGRLFLSLSRDEGCRGGHDKRHGTKKTGRAAAGCAWDEEITQMGAWWRRCTQPSYCVASVNEWTRRSRFQNTARAIIIRPPSYGRAAFNEVFTLIFSVNGESREYWTTVLRYRGVNPATCCTVVRPPDVCWKRSEVKVKVTA